MLPLGVCSGIPPASAGLRDSGEPAAQAAEMSVALRRFAWMACRARHPGAGYLFCGVPVGAPHSDAAVSETAGASARPPLAAGTRTAGATAPDN